MNILNSIAEYAENPIKSRQKLIIYTMEEYNNFIYGYGHKLAEIHIQNVASQINDYERLLPFDYLGLSVYFQTEFKRNPNYEYASSLVWLFLKKEQILKNSDLLYSKPNVFAEVIQYVQNISEEENNHDILQLLLYDRHRYVEKIDKLCYELVDRFNFLKSPVIASAILSLMTGWCPIIQKKFIPIISRTNYFVEEFLKVIDTFSPIIDLGIHTGMIEPSYRFIIIWQIILFLKNYYDNYQKYNKMIS